MTKKDGILLRWLHRRNSVSYEVMRRKFTPLQIRAAFKRGLIKMHKDRDVYVLTKLGTRIVAKDNQHPILCTECLHYNLKYDHYCAHCGRVTAYRLRLNAYIMKRLEK